MKTIPMTRDALVLRTDFADDAAWRAIQRSIAEPVVEFPELGPFKANVEFVSDAAFDRLSPEQILSLLPHNYQNTFLFIVDTLALQNPEHPVLVMDLYDQLGRTFRVIPSEMWGIENNLSIANMDFADFADNVDPDGVFRGFPRG